jgi:CheY-like chemotaxis protein
MHIREREDPMSSLKILLVDDHRENLEFLSGHLKSLGWDVSLASNGREALEKVRTSKPNIIVLDMIMPEMDGFALARFLKDHADYRDIPILAATALSKPGDRDRCLAAGCNDYVAKPFTSQDLEKRLSSLLPAHNGSFYSEKTS